MYLEYWKFKEKPFENTPDRRFLYPSENHRDGLQRLLYAISSEKGCAMLSGEYGCGKTVLVRTVVNELDLNNYEIALINYPFFDRTTFLKEVVHQFGMDSSDKSRVELFRDLSQLFYENVTHGKRNILIIDEAQIIDDPEVFEELRLILNIQLEDRFLINILLVGQPELREKTMLYPQLDQRIAIKCHLHRFDHENTAAYVKHRLRVAGCEREIFSEEALYLLHKISNGGPRRINNVADLCLLEGATRKSPQVDGEIFKHIV
ncbi:MAG: AAA family ATPase [Acidobacteriota bacterium]|nr:MAG: AAA family ATPase [Acidobacteriota bacterium]